MSKFHGVVRRLQTTWKSLCSGWIQLCSGSSEKRKALQETRRFNAEFASLISELKRQHSALLPISQELESQFLDIAASLEKIPATSDALTAASERMLRLATGEGQGENILSQAITHLKDPIEFVERYHASCETFLSTLRAAIEQINRLLAWQKVLRDTMAPLRYLRTLYRVGSAPLAHDTQASFMSLTEDIERLQNQMAQILGQKFDILRANRQTMESLSGRLAQLLGAQGALMQQKRAHLNKALSDLKTDLETNKEKDLKLTCITQQIGQEAGKLVFAIQAQDVISQKISHIVSAITNVASTYQEFRRLRKPGDQSRSLHYISQAAKVESAQLDAVRADLIQTDDELTGALKRIALATDELSHSCVVLDDVDHLTTGTTGMVEVLLATLSEVETIVADTVSSARDAYESIRPIGGQASNVTEIMRELQIKIKLIALNAQIQTAHLAEGTGLDVLATQTATIADETGRISSQIAMELDAFTHKLNSLVGDFERTHREGEEGQILWSRSAKDQSSALHAYRDAALAELTAIVGHSEEMQSLLKAMHQCIHLKSLADQRVQTPADTLRAIHACLEPRLKLLEASEAISESAVAYTRTYTMESEKQVHLSAAGAETDAAALIAPPGRNSLQPEGSAPAAGELLLFDDSPAPSTEVPAPQATSSAEPANDLTAGVSQRETKPKETTPAPGSTSLGDNIELF